MRGRHPGAFAREGGRRVAEAMRRAAAGREPIVEVPAHDVVVLGLGESVVRVWPKTPAAKDWIAENVAGDAQWFGPALIVEPRYLDDLAAGMRADGLVVA